MTKEKIITFLESRDFKRFVFVLGILFLILTAFISVNPEPFLRFGYVGVFIFALFGPASLLIPVLSQHMNIWVLAVVTAAGMAINDSVSWVIGSLGHTVIPHSPKIERIEANLRKHGMPALFFWALIPFPYDLIGFIAGYLGFTYKSFIIPTFLGRLVRFMLLGFGVITLLK
ncbi:MAG TPA: VTT domain-containing protein [Patescibacteria group bacterium]|nr:VTT domain-containing protein [Patescibacteria group bacterium]